MRPRPLLICAVFAAGGAFAAAPQPGAATSAAPGETTATPTEAGGRIDKFLFTGKATGLEAELSVYVPPGTATNTPLPVLYFLHGINGVPGVRELARFQEYAIKAGACGPFLIADPRGKWSPSTWWVDAAKSPVPAETFVATDLIAEVEARYPARTTREARAITGFSMGGNAALAILFGHPETFAVGAAYDGAIWSDPDDELVRRFLSIDRLFGGDLEKFRAASVKARISAYAAMPDRPPVNWQLLAGANQNRARAVEDHLRGLGLVSPDGTVFLQAGHSLPAVLNAGWQTHFRFLARHFAPAP